MLEEAELFYLENPEILNMLRNLAAISANLSKKSNAVNVNNHVKTAPKTTGRKKIGKELKQELIKRYQDVMDGNLLSILFVRVISGKHEISAYVDLEQRLKVAELERKRVKQDQEDAGIEEEHEQSQDEVHQDVIDNFLDISPQAPSDLSQFNHSTNTVVTNNTKNFAIMQQNNMLAFKVVKTSKTFRLTGYPKTIVQDDGFKQVN